MTRWAGLAVVLVFALVVPASAQERTGQWVFTPDQRSQVTTTTVSPYRAVVFVVSFAPDGRASTCTGAFIGPTTVLTAAHCVYGQRAFGGYATRVVVVPAKNGPVDPYGFEAARAWEVPLGYRATEAGGVSEGSELYDYGVVVLPTATLTAQTGWFTLGVAREFPGPFVLAGYDADEPEGTMWTRPIPTLTAGSAFLTYSVSTAHGSSGAPVWRASDRRVVGVNQAGTDGTGPTGPPNVGRRVDTAVVTWIDEACGRLVCQFSVVVDPVPTPVPATPTPRPRQARVFVPTLVR